VVRLASAVEILFQKGALGLAIVWLFAAPGVAARAGATDPPGMREAAA
jgi:hypothetical protein